MGLTFFFKIKLRFFGDFFCVSSVGLRNVGIIVTLIFIEFGSLDHNMGASKRDTLAANLNKKGFF